MSRKSDKEKGEEILKKREKARKGFREGAPMNAQEKKEQELEKVREDALSLDLGLKR